ncbi:MAG: hypothetical protein K5681_04015 [Treponema sp.]|nr:hypothetical protein [Treponema sp.]
MKKLFSLFVLSLFISGVFAQSKALVLKVTLDQKKYSSLDQNTKAFVSSAYMKCLQDLTMIPEISVRTTDTDNELREIQKQSQIDAAVGLGSEAAAYAADKGSRADLLMNISLNNAGNGNYQIVCILSEIETMKMVITENSERLPIGEVTKDLVVDSLVYNILTGLNKRGYISNISPDVKNQLLHLDSSEESFRKYVQEYTRQREEAERELASLRKNAASEEERMELEAQRLALQLKIEMAEKNRQIAEENLRRQQTEDSANQKRQQEMMQMQNAQREKFMKDIKAIEEARTAIRKETLSSLPLKKRIELIETARANLERLESQLDDSITQNDAYYDEKMNAEIDEVYAEPWRKADLSNGEPTSRALNFRNQKVQKIRDNYNAQKKSGQNQLKNAAKATIDGYKSQIQANLSDMEKTTYVFRSIDLTDDYLSLSVSEFDGERAVWDVYSNFELNNITKIDTRNVVLPKTSISYEAMTGSKADLDSEAGYQKYQDMVDMADLYFRTSVPYLYSQIAIKVHYDSDYDIYEVRPVSFQIFKTQNNKKPVISYNEKNFEAARAVQAESVSLAYSSSNSSSSSSAESRVEKTPRKRAQTLEGTQFYQSQEARRGIFMDISYMNGPFYQGTNLNFALLLGGKFIFAGFDMDIAFPMIKPDYYSYNSWSEFYIFDANFVLGNSIKFGFIRPYTAFGIGMHGIGQEELLDTNIRGIHLEAMAGIDLTWDMYSIGAIYRLKYLYGAGFVDTIGMSFGIVY